MTCHYILNKGNTTDTTIGAGTVYRSGASEFTLDKDLPTI
jgi:hypothetical protein